MENTIFCRTGQGYSIIIERDLLSRAASLILPLMPKATRACVVADSNTAPVYGEALRLQLERAGLKASLFVFPAGEASKNLSTVAAMYAHFADHGLTRTDFAVAVGGGVTGDLCGFAAATFLRGIDFIQIPTSLLAQVDSSVGGKTGFDLPQGKNLVGAFWQPRLVLIDPNTLRTLSPRRYADGMAEIIKTACIRDAALFDRLNDALPPSEEEIISACVAIKCGIVERDEREAGERTLLNFGHTLGHAIEMLQNYSGLSHGEAVAVGMAELTRCAERAGLTETGTTERICTCLHRWKLPVSIQLSTEKLAAAAIHDKKTSGDTIKLVLLQKIGESYVYPLTLSALPELLKQ